MALTVDRSDWFCFPLTFFDEHWSEKDCRRELIRHLRSKDATIKDLRDKISDHIKTISELRHEIESLQPKKWRLYINGEQRHASDIEPMITYPDAVSFNSEYLYKIAPGDSIVVKFE